MNTTKKILAVLIITPALVSAGVVLYFVITATTPIQESFEFKIQELMNDYEVPSLAAGKVMNDSLVWNRGFGEQPDLDTVYMIGSIIKTFTATAILQLTESNLLNLDDDINNYLPFDVRHPNYPGIPITT